MTVLRVWWWVETLSRKSFIHKGATAESVHTTCNHRCHRDEWYIYVRRCGHAASPICPSHLRVQQPRPLNWSDKYQGIVILKSAVYASQMIVTSAVLAQARYVWRKWAQPACSTRENIDSNILSGLKCLDMSRLPVGV